MTIEFGLSQLLCVGGFEDVLGQDTAWPRVDYVVLYGDTAVGVADTIALSS